MNKKNNKNVLRTLATGAVAAVMAVGIALPGSASAASSDKIEVTNSNWKTVVQNFLKTNNNDLNSLNLSADSDLVKKVQSILDQIKKQQKNQDATTPSQSEQTPSEEQVTEPVEESTPAEEDTTDEAGQESNSSKEETVVTKPSTSTPTTKPTTKPSTETTQPTESNTSTNTSESSSFEAEVIRLVNVERTKAGLSKLTEDTNLSKVALVKATDMKTNNYFSHTSPTYGSPFDMMKQFGISYKYAGENIAMGQKTPAAVMDAWMNSEGHRANILSANFTHIGVGYDNGYWVQQFISK